MLLLTQHLHATDPRDKIFAFHGLLSALGAKLPPPDYTKSVQQVYREAAAVAIRHDNSLHMLSAITGQNRLEGLPSWVPDWSNSLPITEIASWKDHDIARASWPEELFHISDDVEALALQGREIETIEVTSIAFPHRFHVRDSAKKTHQQREINVIQHWLKDFGPNKRQISMAKFFSGLTEGPWKRTQPQSDLDADTLSKYWVKGIKRIGPKHRWGVEERLRDEAVECAKHDFAARKGIHRSIIRFHKLVQTLLDRKVMFMTSDGRLGITSQAIQKRDSIVFLQGVNLPMVLRQHGFTKWHLVAPAYIYGAMEDFSASAPVLNPLRGFVIV